MRVLLPAGFLPAGKYSTNRQANKKKDRNYQSRMSNNEKELAGGESGSEETLRRKTAPTVSGRLEEAVNLVRGTEVKEREEWRRPIRELAYDWLNTWPVATDALPPWEEDGS
ncbi:unnamed protein product [Pleuronectes platessa]|uniref:Uncharacterized protein n=1 Tax=Pleuronectes platessa TaxID=8262 RepID=A0A9N7VI64_PLEPL|nr:unnamed protein product [Pleuronectes platessa]